ncbi:MAG: enoyl-CoA hydratase/isomerase family protein [Planctomycetes bacterium]|nr:enoyl-CoA hydratase/isomerase family protein [Planctomycetota bacterium]
MNGIEQDRAQTAAPATAPIGLPVEIGDDGIVTLRLGRSDERVVTITPERMSDLAAALDRIASDTRVRGVIVTGPNLPAEGPGMFCAGADIQLIDSIADAAAGEAAATRGRTLLARLQQLRVPVVAAIDGPCLGGGCELALFCDVRLATDEPGTQIGLPEVKLGILPGFGGTQTLPRLLGLPKALDLILTGRLLRGKQALRTGLVDRLVPRTKLLAAARAEVEKLAAKDRKRPARRLRGLAFWLSKTPLRWFAARAATQQLQRGPGRFYPAPHAALQSCLNAFTMPVEQGFAAEARQLGRLVVTPISKGLLRLFFLTERSKRLGKHDAARDLQRALVVGGGVMGAGIACELAQRGLAVRLCDLDLQALVRGKARLGKELDKRVRRKRLTAPEAMAIQDRLQASTEWGHLRDTDLWLEAVVEDLQVKRKLMGLAIERGLPEHAVLATNTSSLSVTAMAEGLPHPERVVGIHFFNPPEKMPLVEVIRGATTDDATVATACRLAVRMGKFPVVVGDAPGFLVNRCLAPYLNEAARLVLEGTAPEAVDKAMLDLGMPMGPCRLLDEVGFDVATKVSEVLQNGFPERMQPCELFAAMAGAGLLGQKTGGGIYGKDGKRPGPGRKVIAELRAAHGTPGREASRSEIVQRLIYPMVDEAYRCVDEGIVAHEDDVDLGLVMGIGFPPFTGGITRYARREGLSTIVHALDELARLHGPRFEVSDGMRRRATS